MEIDKTFHRGDVFIADLGTSCGSEQGGRRPVVIIQNDIGCIYAPTVTILPVTANLKKLNQSTHRLLKNVPFLRKKSMVLGEQIGTIDKSRISYYLGKLDHEDLDGIDEAVKRHLGFY